MEKLIRDTLDACIRYRIKRFIETGEFWQNLRHALERGAKLKVIFPRDKTCLKKM